MESYTTTQKMNLTCNCRLFRNLWRYILIMVLFPGSVLSAPARGMADDPNEMIYQAYINEEMHLWERAIILLENEYKVRNDIEILYDLTLARYGYIGFLLGSGNNDEGRKHISLAEESLEKLVRLPEFESSSYALQAAMYAFRISITPWRAVFWGRRSMNLINKALETDPANPSAWIEHGNAMFYAPAALGGSKEEAVKSYSRAASLMEAGMMDKQRWLYLNTLVGLGKSYSETGNRLMARTTYLKALEFEPQFKWVKDKLLPQLMKE
jgi:tetratricopeptide (TPR) repeat protein